MVTILEYTAILSALAGISATTIIILQFRHMEKHRNLEISMKLFEWGEDDRLRKAFRWIAEEFQFETYEKSKSCEDTHFDYPYEVTAFFEQVGFMVEKKFVDLDVIVDRLGSHTISNWKKMEPWIMALRKESNDENFGKHFQRLYEGTIKYMKMR